jgi:hypothetical protein
MIRFMKVALWSLCILALGGGVAPAVEPVKPPGLVVHEWGTFSTFSGSDGTNVRFYPNDQDLPDFMYRGPWDQTKSGRGAVLVSLETPVVYFYSDRETTASVRVDFPEGVMTDWYPQATRPPHRRLDWTNIKVFPRGHELFFPREEKKPSRYYAAREVDASPIQVEAKKGKLENEKFLFYRGVGDVRMPIRVKALGSNIFTVQNEGKEAIPAFVFVQIRDGKLRFEKYGHLSQNSMIKVTPPAAESSPKELAACVTKLLIEQGLYEKEARAMVKTWKSDWFDTEGTRVLYLVPSAVTESFLPLKVTPKPESLVRVLVGRHDVLTPEEERRLEHLVKEQEEYQKLMSKLGRYAVAAHNAAYERIRATEKPKATPR